VTTTSDTDSTGRYMDGDPLLHTASQEEWTLRGDGPSLFQYWGGGLGRTHRSWKLLNIGGRTRGVIVRFSGSVFDAGLTPASGALAVGPYFEILYDDQGNYRGKTPAYKAERRDIDPELVDDAWQLPWPDVEIPAGYVAATDQTIKRRISAKDVDRAFQRFDEPILSIVLYGHWEDAEGKLTLETLTGPSHDPSYRSSEDITPTRRGRRPY